MTKIAIISDIHANIDALNLVLKDIEKRNVDKIICLGDLVTKYFYPAEVVDAIKSNSDIVIKGNCDDLVSNDERYKFAREKLGLNRIEYLDNLPKKEQLIINKTLLNLFHSTLNDLETMFNPIFDDNNLTKYKDKVLQNDKYNEMFLSDEPQISLVGHTHLNYIALEKNNKLNIIKSPSIITNTQRAIINVGSVGEHSQMKLNGNGQYVPIIDSFLTYVIINDINLKNSIHAEIIKVPYKNTLKKVYFDMVKMQKEGKAPNSPMDTKKVHDSLINMDVRESDIKEEFKKRGL